MLVSHEGWILISDRTPLKSRWGGWYVTGTHGSQTHLGNVVIQSLADFDRLEELRVGNLETIDDRQRNSGDYKALCYIEQKERDKERSVWQSILLLRLLLRAPEAKPCC